MTSPITSQADSFALLPYASPVLDMSVLLFLVLHSKTRTFSDIKGHSDDFMQLVRGKTGGSFVFLTGEGMVMNLKKISTSTLRNWLNDFLKISITLNRSVMPLYVYVNIRTKRDIL